MTDILFDFISLPNAVASLITWAIIGFYYKTKFESWSIKKITSLEDTIFELKNEISDIKDSHEYLRADFEILEDELTPEEIKIQRLVGMGFPREVVIENLSFKK